MEMQPQVDGSSVRFCEGQKKVHPWIKALVQVDKWFWRVSRIQDSTILEFGYVWILSHGLLW